LQQAAPRLYAGENQRSMDKSSLANRSILSAIRSTPKSRRSINNTSPKEAKPVPIINLDDDDDDDDVQGILNLNDDNNNDNKDLTVKDGTDDDEGLSSKQISEFIRNHSLALKESKNEPYNDVIDLDEDEDSDVIETVDVDNFGRRHRYSSIQNAKKDINKKNKSKDL